MSQTTNGAGPLASPVSYPTFVLAGQTYVLKFSMGTMYRLEQIGIDMKDLNQLQESGKRIDTVLKMASLMLGTVDEAGAFHAANFTPIDLADALDDVGSFTELSRAVTTALLKAVPAKTIAQDALATQGSVVN